MIFLPLVLFNLIEFELFLCIKRHSKNVCSTFHVVLGVKAFSPQATSIWEGCGLANDLRTINFRALVDCIAKASKILECDAFGDFLTVIWKC